MTTPRRHLELGLDGRWEQAGLEPPRLYPYDRVHLARRARDRAGVGWDADPRALAAALGLRVTPGRPRGCGGEATDGTGAAYVWCADRQERGLRVLHGLAHALLVRDRWDHSHADAWLLTCELAVPHDVCRVLIDDEIVRLAHVPEWFARRWSTVSRRLGARAREAEAA